MNPRTDRRQAGFTLIELLAAVALVAIALQMLPAVQRVREAANRDRAERTLRQIASGMESNYKQTGKLSFTNPGTSKDGYRIAVVENTATRVHLRSEPVPGVTGSMTGVLVMQVAPWGVQGQLNFVPTPGADAGRKRMLANAYDAAARMYGRLFQLALPAVQKDALASVRSYIESPLTMQSAPLSLSATRDQIQKLPNGSEYWLNFTRALELGVNGEDWATLPGLTALPAVQNSDRMLNFANIAGFVRRTMADPAAAQKVAGLLEQEAGAAAIAEMRKLQAGFTVNFLDTEAALLLADSM
ncbi:MAG: prepilin-type N-terminal cleavage/methylation domain-containing protein [Acidobacteria bacterium]|nr:prepilin-type N-terminal cleavage/methylation domain-containing protein [Acidobacteriota bacterium]